MSYYEIDYSSCMSNETCFHIMKFLVLCYLIAMVLCVILSGLGKFHWQYISIEIVGVYILHIVDIVLLRNYDKDKIYLYLYIIELISYLLVIHIIIKLLKAEKVFYSDKQFIPQGISVLCVIYGVFLFPYEFIIIRGENSIIREIRRMTVIVINVILFALVYSKIVELIHFINEKESNEDIILDILVENMETFELSEIYIFIKNVLFVMFAMFIIEQTIQIMNSLVVVGEGMKVLLRVVIVGMKEGIVIVVICGFVYAVYLCRKEYDAKEIVEDEEFISVEMMDVSKNKEDKEDDDNVEYEEEDEFEEEENENDIQYTKNITKPKKGLVLENN